jgi:hypothetical protein
MRLNGKALDSSSGPASSRAPPGHPHASLSIPASINFRANQSQGPIDFLHYCKHFKRQPLKPMCALPCEGAERRTRTSQQQGTICPKTRAATPCESRP